MSKLAFMEGGGVSGACARSVDWSRTALGPVETWPACLRTLVGVILHSRHPMFLWWGPELIQLYNDAYLPSFGIGKHPAAMGQRGRECWPEIWSVIGPQIEGVMAHGRATWNEDQLIPILRNGRLEDVYWTYGYSPVFDDTGVAGTLVVCTETTARVVAERRLGARSILAERLRDNPGGSADLFHGMTADIPYALVFSVDDGVRRLTTSSGLDPSDLAIATAFFDERAEALLRMDAPPAQGAEPMIAGPALSRDGVSEQVFFAPIGGPSRSEITGFVVLGVTSKLLFDGAYRAYLEEIARVLSATRAERLLRLSRDKAQQQLMISDRLASVGTLAAGVAHEINNPLTSVTANLDLGLEIVQHSARDPLSGRLRELEALITDAKAGAARVTTIVRGLKTFSRTDAGRRIAIGINPLLDVSVDMTLNEMRHRARLVKDYGPVPDVEGDDASLGEVFVNLLLNAAHAIPEGRVDQHEIRITTSTDARGRAVIEIKDSGHGIPADIVGRIFDPFFTTRPVGGGAGLGLSIARNTIVSMGGELTVASVPDQGSTFRIVLPAATTSPLLAPNGASAPPRAGRRIAVLIVDDEPAICIALGRILAAHDVTAVACVTDALRALEGRDFDVILSDLMMPDVTGMEFHALVMKQAPAVAARMVFVTGGAFTSAARGFLDTVPNERIEKPFSPKTVRELVQRVVDP